MASNITSAGCIAQAADVDQCLVPA